MFSFYHHHADTDLLENQLHKSANEENSLIPSVKIPAGKMPSSKLPSGNKLAGNIPACKTTAGKIPTGKILQAMYHLVKYHWQNTSRESRDWQSTVGNLPLIKYM